MPRRQRTAFRVGTSCARPISVLTTQRRRAGPSLRTPLRSTFRLRSVTATLALFLTLCAGGHCAGPHAVAGVSTVPGMPPVTDPTNLYSETRSDKLSPAVAQVPSRVYVTNVKSHEVHVIDPNTLTVVDHFKVGRNPQHVVPSWALTTLWVTNNAEWRTDGTLTP